MIVKFKNILLIAFCSAYSRVLFSAEYDIGAAEDSMFDGITEFLQAIVTFMLAQGALFVVLVGVVLGLLAWAFAPEGRGLGWAFRAMIAGIAIGTLVTEVADNWVAT